MTKCKLAGVRLPKEVIEATCRIKCIDLTKLAVKITGTFYSYNKKIGLEQEILILKEKKLFKKLCYWKEYV